jgi:hypothetical protein
MMRIPRVRYGVDLVRPFARTGLINFPFSAAILLASFVILGRPACAEEAVGNVGKSDSFLKSYSINERIGSAQDAPENATHDLYITLGEGLSIDISSAGSWDTECKASIAARVENDGRVHVMFTDDNDNGPFDVHTRQHSGGCSGLDKSVDIPIRKGDVVEQHIEYVHHCIRSSNCGIGGTWYDAVFFKHGGASDPNDYARCGGVNCKDNFYPNHNNEVDIAISSGGVSSPSSNAAIPAK